MRNTVLLLFLLFLSCRSVNSDQDFSAYQKLEFSDKNGVLPYRLLLPENYNGDKSYPLLIVLHGAGERGNDNEAQLTHGAEIFLSEDFRSRNQAIVVFPQCPEESYWSNVNKEQILMSFTFTFSADGAPTKAMESLQSLVDGLQEEYKVDKNRLYIGGLSMGGMGTMEIVRRNPDTFAAAFAICGGAHPDTAPSMTKTKWWIFHGDDDMVVDYQHSVNMVEALKNEDADVKFTTYEGVNHNSWENAFAEPQLLPWLFSHSKSE